MRVLACDIQRETAAEYAISADIMRKPFIVGTRGTKAYLESRPRQVAIYLAASLTTHSYVRIGQLFGGRDHSTVINAIKRTRRRLATEIELQEAVRRIARKVLA